jgi:Zn-dependent protease
VRVEDYSHIGMMAGSASTLELCSNMARLSLVLCFFNLIPIPPLDGSQVVRVLTGMSYETYNKIARFGFIIVILVLQIPIVRQLLAVITGTSWRIIAGWMGVGGL